MAGAALGEHWLSGDITRSLDRGAEGIGLFRTEVPFMSKDRFPTEQEQRTLYREHGGL